MGKRRHLSLRAVVTVVTLTSCIRVNATGASTENDNRPNHRFDTLVASMTMTLDARSPTRFVLAFRGNGRVPLTGPICYTVDGYNESCVPTGSAMLSKATRIELLAPGSVPLELLRGYQVIVRFPEMSPTRFRFEVAR